MKQRLRVKLREVAGVLRQRRHQPIPEQGRWLASVVRGHIAYYGVPTNRAALDSLRSQVGKSWHRALGRRSQRADLDWSRMGRLINRWLPSVRIAHPWPEQRFDVRTRGKSPVRLVGYDFTSALAIHWLNICLLSGHDLPPVRAQVRAFESVL
jgi:hypothetical protein